jgi:hypothetical protein
VFKGFRRYVRQQHIGFLALFVALGGSAYAAATINSASVVDNSLTGADIRGRAASPGKPFTEGTLTGEDVRGSFGAPGRPAVNGSLTGADIANDSLTGADILEQSLGKVPNADRLDGLDSNVFLQKSQQAADSAKLGGLDPNTFLQKSQQAADSAKLGGQDASSFLLKSQQAADSAKLGGQDSSDFLQKTQQAADSAKLGGLAPGAFGTAVRSASQQSSECAVQDTPIQCAPVTVRVPEGRAYKAIVWSSLSAYHLDAGNKALVFCPYYHDLASGGCLTPGGGFQEGISLAPNYSESASTVGAVGFPLNPGNYVFSTSINLTYGGGALAAHPTQRVHTTVLLFDAAVPALPVDPPAGTSGGTSGQSSGGTSGQSSSSSSGGTDNP